MKKFLFLMLTLLTFGFAAAPLSAQNTLTVADGTETNGYVPVYGYYADAYLRSQIIYPESMLGDMLNFSISEMTFYLSSTPSLTATFEVKIGTCADSVFTSGFLSDATTTVYSGPLVFINNQLIFELENPYTYTGGNLLVEVSTIATGNWTSTTFYGITSNGSSVQGNNYSGVSSVSPTQRNFLPKTTFSYGIPSLCSKPTNVTASNITTTSAEIAWLGGNNDQSYNIEYMLSSGSDWTNALTETSTTASATLYNLLPSSTYKVRVQTVCSDNTETNWSSVISFQTACDAIPITEATPWFEDFEGYQGSGEQPFVCWATPVTASGGGPFVYCGYTPACHSGSNSAELKGATQMLVLPEFSNDIHDLRLSFWATAVTPSNGTLEIGVLPDMDDLDSFEFLAYSGSPSSRNGVGNYMGPFDFNGIQATSGRIAFRYTSSGTGNSWNLDDFTVELSPSCTSPVKTSVTASNIDGHNATISWTDNDDTHFSWTVYYKSSNDVDYTSATSTDTFLTLSGLNPETTYTVYVVTNCGGIPSDDGTIPYNFTTDVACPAPTQVTASPVYITEATITWNSTATSFNIEYGETGFSQGTGTTETAFSNTITLNQLTPETSYTVYVQADCGTDDGTSQWASVQFTTLPSCPKPTEVVTSNLTVSSADLEWTAGYEETEWEVTYGTQGFNPDSSTVSEIVTGTPYLQLQNLSANTRYDVYVRAVCSSTEYSAWSNLYYFLTPCDAAQIPMTENFDSYPSWYSPDCWRKFEAGNTGSYVSYGAYIYNTYAYSGENSMKFLAGSSSSGYALVRLPDLDVDDITTLQVKLMAKKASGTRPLIVGLTPDFNSVDSIFVLGTFADLTNNFEERIVSLESYPGTTGYLVIGLPKGYSASADIYVDDVIIEERPNCMYPTNLTATSIGETSVMISWTELGTSESWNIEYGPMGFTPGNGITESVTDSTSYIVENLAESTAYDFYVQSDCGSMESQWAGPVTVVTSQYNMAITGSDTVTTCGMMIYDNGGPDGNYSVDCNSILVIYPATEGTMVMLSGISNTESSFDFLKIYDGVGTDGTPIVNYSGQQNVSVISSTGPLTIHFTSDYTVVKSGFELLASCVSCFPPSNVTASNPTLDGVTITWSGNADSYTVYLTGAMTGEYTTTDTFYTFSGLTGSSTYSVQVRSYCGSDSSILSQAVSFNTSCDLISITADLPWFEDFDSYPGSGEQPFICWETPIHPNGPFVYCGHSPSCHSGANSAEFKGSENMLVLPSFTNDVHELRLSFWATATSVSLGQVEVGVITDPADPTTFESIAFAGTPGPRGSSGSGHGNFMGPFDFNGVQATNGRIALRYTNTNASASWNLDDFTVSLSPNCPSPVKTSVQASNIDGHNATISFTDNDLSHNSWTVYYREASNDDTDPWTPVTTSTTTVILTNLDPETTYQVYVVTNCTTPDIEEDATLTIQFTTLVACPAPQNVTVSNIGMTSATVTWGGNADSYTVVCGDFTTSVTGNSADITGLTSGTAYTVTITADCGVDGTSQPATVNFNTANCEVADQCTYTFYLTDSYGDGWNGGTISVQQNGTTVATIGLPSGNSATETVNLCDNVSTSLVWNAGSYVNEVGFTLLDPSGDTVYTISDMSNYTTFTFVTNCNGAGPVITDPTVATNAATNVAATSATLNGTITNPDNVTITAMGFEWKATSGGTYTPVTVTGNTLTYNLNNLSENTNYTYKAFITFNGTTVYGSEMTFTTTGGSGPVITDPTVATNAATAIGQYTATLNAAVTNPDNVTITAKGFEWKTTTGGTFTQIAGTGTGNTFTANLNGLTANTGYTYKAFITFNGTTVYGSEMTFTTLPEDTPEPCDVPTGLTTGTITHESIAISWDANPNVSSWNIQYRPVGGTLNSATATTNSYTITGLAPETQYEIQVQAVCSDGQTSDWSPAVTATTLTGINEHLLNSISLYPNPAKDVVNVQCTMNNAQVKAIEVFDVYGKLLQTVSMTPETTTINVSGLASGMYFVRVTTEEGAVTKSFVKK